MNASSSEMSSYAKTAKDEIEKIPRSNSPYDYHQIRVAGETRMLPKSRPQEIATTYNYPSVLVEQSKGCREVSDHEIRMHSSLSLTPYGRRTLTSSSIWSISRAATFRTHEEMPTIMTWSARSICGIVNAVS